MAGEYSDARQCGSGEPLVCCRCRYRSAADQSRPAVLPQSFEPGRLCLGRRTAAGRVAVPIRCSQYTTDSWPAFLGITPIQASYRLSRHDGGRVHRLRHRRQDGSAVRPAFFVHLPDYYQVNDLSGRRSRMGTAEYARLQATIICSEHPGRIMRQLFEGADERSRESQLCFREEMRQSAEDNRHTHWERLRHF
jgi:hypothetical protein